MSRRSLKMIAAGVGLVGVAFSLQGCGGGGDDTTTTTTLAGETTTTTTLAGETSTTTTMTATGSTTATTTTTEKLPPRTPGMTDKEAADYLNELYYDYDETNSTSLLGLTVSMLAEGDSFFKNIFCSEYDNPVVPGGHTKCFQGQADCRLSTSVYNHKVSISSTTGAATLGLQRRVGAVFDMKMVEEELARCSYLFDGMTGRRLNNGCGRSGTDSCDAGKGGAFEDLCASGKVCTADDEEVKGDLCKGFGGDKELPENREAYACLVPGAALNYHGQDDYKPSTVTGIRDMLKQRMAVNDGKGKQAPNMEEYTEVVVDERLLATKLWEDPAVAVPAIIYAKDTIGTINKDMAKKARDEYCKYMKLDKKIPIVAIDNTVKVDAEKRTPVFFAEAEDLEIQV